MCFLSTVLAYNTCKAPESCMNLQVFKSNQQKIFRGINKLFQMQCIALVYDIKSSHR